jgi:hypothetical protein
MAESGVCSRLEGRMEAMPGDPRECRQQAQECLYLARHATSDPACRPASTATAYLAEGRVAGVLNLGSG